MKIIDPLTNPTAHGGEASDAFDVVIPSMPGYWSLRETDLYRLGAGSHRECLGPAHEAARLYPICRRREATGALWSWT